MPSRSTINRPHARICEHLVDGPPCAVVPVDVELEVVEAVGLVQMLDYYDMAAHGRRGQAGQSLQNYLTE